MTFLIGIYVAIIAVSVTLVTKHLTALKLDAVRACILVVATCCTAVGGAHIHITTTVYLSLIFMTNDTLGRTGPHKFSGHSQMHFCGYSGGIVMPRHTQRKVKEKEASARAPTPRLNRQLLSFLYLD